MLQVDKTIEKPTLFLLNRGFVVKPLNLHSILLPPNSEAYGVYHNGFKLFNMLLSSSIAKDDVPHYAIHFLREKDYLPSDE